jgi:hypothetical protein
MHAKDSLILFGFLTVCALCICVSVCCAVLCCAVLCVCVCVFVSGAPTLRSSESTRETWRENDCIDVGQDRVWYLIRGQLSVVHQYRGHVFRYESALDVHINEATP